MPRCGGGPAARWRSFVRHLPEHGWEVDVVDNSAWLGEYNAIAVDGAGSAYVTGHTLSSGFPLSNPYQAQKNGIQDIFVTKFSPAGAVAYSTFLGSTIGKVVRINPDANGPNMSEVDLQVDLGFGAFPYNYSDMTGLVTMSNPPFGTWTTICDGECEGAKWGRITWNGHEPAGTHLIVELRAANEIGGLFGDYTLANNGSLSGPLYGRYLEVRVSFKVDVGMGCDGVRPPSPILFDLAAESYAKKTETYAAGFLGSVIQPCSRSRWIVR